MPKQKTNQIDQLFFKYLRGKVNKDTFRAKIEQGIKDQQPNIADRLYLLLEHDFSVEEVNRMIRMCVHNQVPGIRDGISALIASRSEFFSPKWEKETFLIKLQNTGGLE